MRDLKYIIKRIIIGVGIVVVLSCLNGCKVKALSFTDNYRSKTKSSIINDSDIVELKTYNYITLYQNQVNKSVYWCASYSNTCYEMYFTNNNFQYENIGILITSPSSSSNSSLLRSCSYMSASTLPKFYEGSGFVPWNYANYYSDTYVFCVASRNSDSSFISAISGSISNGENTEAFYGSGINPSVSSSNYQWYSNINWNYYGNLEVSDDNLIGQSSPEFISFNAIPITTNNVITSYTVQPEFSSFDTENYVYQYSFDTNRWLSLTENEQILRINNNSTIYVRIKDKNTYEYIDSQSLIISSIGTFFNNQTYDIKFSGEYRTSNDLNNNNSGTSSVILNYQIYIDYLPKSSLLKYQYQYVNNGSILDDNNWENVSTSDNGSITYVASQNGTLFARILDKDNNVLKTNTLTVSSIGKLAIDNDSSGFGGLFSKFSNSINFAGPLSSIINIPIQLITTISSGLAGGLTCNDYSIGSLYGTNLVIPCVNVKQHLGNSLYTTIDLIIACCMIYYIIKMFGELYTNLLFIHKNPIQDLGKRGD